MAYSKKNNGTRVPKTTAKSDELVAAENKLLDAMMSSETLPWHDPHLAKGVCIMSHSEGKPLSWTNMILCALYGWSADEIAGLSYVTGYGKAQTAGKAASQYAATPADTVDGSVPAIKIDPETGKPYRARYLLRPLMSKGYVSVKDKDGNPVLDDDGNPKKIPYNKIVGFSGYLGIPVGLTNLKRKFIKDEERDNASDVTADKIISDIHSKLGITFVHEDRTGSWYRPTKNIVNVPDIRLMSSTAEYYGAVSHETAHAVFKHLGYADKTNYHGNTQDRAYEEIVVEIAASLCVSYFGLMTKEFELNSSAYIGTNGWGKRSDLMKVSDFKAEYLKNPHFIDKYTGVAVKIFHFIISGGASEK